MLRVKAIWTVGYPSVPDKKIYSDGDTFECDNKWGKKKAEQGKVKILEEIEDEEIEDAIDITELKTRDDFSFIEKCNEKEQIKKWIEQERKGENRKTILGILNDRLEELEE